MAKAKSRPLKRDGMTLFSKISFTSLFFLMGLSIVGAGLKGAPSTAPVVILIGMLMNIIGIAPYVIPYLYKNYVDPKIEEAAATT